MRLNVPLRDERGWSTSLGMVILKPGAGGKNWEVVRIKLEECFGKVVISRRIARGNCALPSCNCIHFSLYNSLFKPGQL